MTESLKVLDRIHKALLKELTKDPEPESEVARFTMAGVGSNPTTGRVLCKGDSYLMYVHDRGLMSTGPREHLPDELDPDEVCTRLITATYGKPDGPRRITFRYDRVDGKWRGGYAVETFENYRAQVAKRADLDTRMTDAMRSLWKKGMKELELVYGSVGKQEGNGPWLVITRPQYQFEHLKAPAPFPELWEEYVAHFHEFGHANVYRGTFTLEGPKATLQELRNIDIDYGI